MGTGKTLFAQLMDFLPWESFHRIVDRYDGNYRIRSPVRRATLADANERRDWHIYADFAQRLQAGAFFVTRAKSNTDLRRLYSAPSDRTQRIICDQTIALAGFSAQRDYPHYLRRIRFKDPETGKTLVFLTTLFEKIPLNKGLFDAGYTFENDMSDNQLNLFDP